LLGIPLPKFLAAYKAANNLQGIPTPTINFNFQDELDQINGTAPLKAETCNKFRSNCSKFKLTFVLTPTLKSSHAGEFSSVKKREKSWRDTNNNDDGDK